MPTLVTRTHATRYWVQTPLHPESGSYHCWAEIILCDSGTLLIHSDYGEWAYNWSSHGRASLKHFLCEIHDEHLVRKLTRSRPKRFNVEKTVAWIRGKMVEMVEGEASVREWHGGQHVRVPFNGDSMIRGQEALGRIADEWGHSADLFLRECLEEPSLAWVSSHIGDTICVMEPDPQCVEFTQRLWPVFVAHLRQEIAGAEWASVEDY